MMPPGTPGTPDPLAPRRFLWLARLATWSAVSIGALTLFGYFTKSYFLSRWFPDLPEIRATTAAGLVVLGFSTAALLPNPIPLLNRGRAALGGLTILILSTSTIGFYFWDIPFPNFMPSPSSLKDGSTGTTPSLLTALNFFFLGTAILLSALVPGRAQRTRDILIAVPLFTGLLAAIGYLGDIPSYYGWHANFPHGRMSPQSSLALILVSSGLLLSRPETGIMFVLTGTTSGSVVARRLLLAPLLIPLIAGLARRSHLSAGPANSDFIDWIFSLVNVFAFTMVVWWVASLLHRTENTRREAEANVRILNLELEDRVARRTAELERTRESLLHNQRRLKQILQSAPEAILTLDAMGKIIDWNPPAATIFGWRADEAAGLSFAALVPVENFEPSGSARLAALFAENNPEALGQRLVMRLEQADKASLLVEYSISRAEADTQTFYSVFLRDITAQSQAAETMSWLASFPKLNPNPIVEVDWLKRRLLFVNPAADHALPDLVRRGVNHPWLQDLAGVIAQIGDRPEQIVQREIKIGSQHYFQTLHCVGGEGRMRVYGADITARCKIEAELEAQRAELQIILETVPAMIFYKDAQHRLLRTNRELERVIGRPRAEIEGHSDQELGSPFADRYAQDEDEVIASGEAKRGILEPLATADGVRWLQTDKIPFRDPGGRIVGIIGFSVDVTERELARQKLEGQLTRLRLLSRTTQAIGERQDPSSIFQVVLHSLEEHLGIHFACVCRFEAVGRFLTINSIGQQSVELATKMGMQENAHLAIDGNGLSRCIGGELVYEPNLPVVPHPFSQRLAAAGLRSLVIAPLLVESQVFGVLVAARREAGAFTSDDSEFLRTLSAHVALASHQAGLYAALQRAYDDLRQTQQAVMQHERLRALGKMASGIAHDINNALSPVALYTESLLEQEPNLSPRARDYLETMSRSIGDVAATVARLREFYREREPQMVLRRVDLNEMVRQVLELTRPRWRDMPSHHGIAIEPHLDLDPDLPAIYGVESEIREALTNLVFNAIDAMAEGGKLTFRTTLQETTVASPENPVLRHVQLEVQDTGAGMDDATLRSCLEPFFTTKGERGTGLGLAMVFGIVQRHSAEIDIKSAVGRGTTVRLSFPAPNTPPPLASDDGNLAQPLLPPRRQRILVVDDDPLLLRSLQRSLETDGHAVTAANGGRAGLEAFEAALATGQPFEIVITDLGMPYVDGRQVASKIKAQAPHTPVILLTGWGQRLVAEGEVPPHVDRVLSKPPKLSILRATLTELSSQGVGTLGRSGKPS